MDQPLPEGAWPIISASPIPYYPHSQVPREMTRADMDKVIADFVQAVERGERAGFDMVGAALRARLSAGELHLAADQPAHRRIRRQRSRTACASRWKCSARMRKAWPDEKPMSVRISATDWEEGGLTGDDAVEVARAFARGRLRPDRRVDRADRARCRAGLRPHVPDAVLRPDPQRGRARHHVRRRDHDAPIRSTRSWRPAAPTSWRWRGRIWSIRSSP